MTMNRIRIFANYVWRPCPSGEGLIGIRLAWRYAGIVVREGRS